MSSTLRTARASTQAALAVLAAGLGSVVLMALVVVAARPAAAAPRTATIRLTSVAVSVRRRDVGPKGASKGDTVSYVDSLLNRITQFGRGKGAAVGHDTGTLTFTGPHTAVFSGTTTLPGGTLRLEGRVEPGAGGGVIIPVVGGTGRYARVAGTLTVGAGGARVANTYRLTFPALPVA